MIQALQHGCRFSTLCMQLVLRSDGGSLWDEHSTAFPDGDLTPETTFVRVSNHIVTPRDIEKVRFLKGAQ